MFNKYLNIETGEILSKKDISKGKVKHEIDCYVGIDTKFPSECLTQDHLLEAIGALDGYLHKSPKVNYSALLKSVTDSLLTVKESGIISYLSEHVTAWNYYIGRVCDLDHIISDKKNLNKYLKELEKQGLIKIEHKGFFYKDSVVIRISPFYVWKGDMSLRGNEIRSWYGNGIGE